MRRYSIWNIVPVMGLWLFLHVDGNGQSGRPVDSAVLSERWFDLGNYLLLDKEWDPALQAYRNALQFAQGKMQQARIHQNLGSLHFLLSDYQKATIHFEYAFLQYDGLSSETERKAEICLNLGFTFLERGDPEQASHWFEKAGNGTPSVSCRWRLRLCLGKGNVLFSRGLFRDAIKTYSQGLSECRFTVPVTEEEQWIRKNLAWSYQAIDQVDSARRTLDDLLDRMQATETRDRLLIPEVLLQKGILLSLSGDDGEAFHILELALERLNKEHPPDTLLENTPYPLRTADVLKYRIWCEKLKAEWKLCRLASSGDGAVNGIYREVLQALHLGETLVKNHPLRALVAQADGCQRLLTAMALEILFGMEDSGLKIREVIKVMGNLTKFEELCYSDQDNGDGRLADTALATLMDLKNHLFKLHKQRFMEEAATNKPEGILVTQQASVLNRLYLLGAGKERETDTSPSAEVIDFDPIGSPSPAAIRSSLHTDEALIKYLLCDTTLFIFLLTTDTSILVKEYVGNAFAEDIQGYVKALKALDPQGFVLFSSRLYQRLIGTVDEFLEAKRTLQIVPDRRFISLPVEALSASDEYVSEADSNYLIQRFEIAYFTSLRSWYGHRMNPSDNRKSHQFMYDFGGCAPEFSGEGIHDLPYARSEVERVSGLFRLKNRNAITFTGKGVSPGVLFSLANQSRIVHLATHGYRNTDHPEFSGWMLSGDPAPSPPNAPSGSLELGALQCMRLKSDLLVLSSCSVGLEAGDHWYKMTHFPYNFFRAGINHILFALWDVPDNHTNEFMSLFYRNYLDGKSYSTALRDAKLQMLSNPETAFPTIWAVFVLLSD